MEVFGKVFRPPSEANSLIVQATVGCSHNKCRFCDMYKEKKFFIRAPEDTIRDLAQAANYYPEIEKIFLGDGDALIMKTPDLIKILKAIKVLFTNNPRITCYATPKSILNKTQEELSELKENGLRMVYLGLESGSDKVLELMDKGVSSKDMIRAAKKIKDAGILLSVTAISGLGGKENIIEHAIETGKILSEMNPDYIGLLTLRAEGRAPLVEDIRNGKFQMLTPEEVMFETKILLENLDSPNTIFRANHISNYINLAGTLNQDKEELLNKINKALEGKEVFKSEELRNWDLNHMY